MTLAEFIMFLLSLLTFTGQVKTNSDCCSPEQVLLAEKNVCWDPKSNITSPLLLKCKDLIRQFTINENMELNLKLDKAFTVDSLRVDNTSTMKDVILLEKTQVALSYSDGEDVIITGDILGYCTIVSILFLIATAFIYSAISELRDVQGKCIINLCTSLSIGQGILVIMQFMEYSDMTLCATRGFMAYFFLVAAFFWTNVIVIHVLLHMRRPAMFDYSWREIKWYSLYAWGTPAVLTVCMAIVNFHPGSHSKPGIGLRHCWFTDKTQQWYYMFSVICVLLAANICICTYIALVLRRLLFPSNHLRALRCKFIMTVRLIILMGVPWVFDMLESLAGRHIIWSIINMLTCLHGLLVFLLLVVCRQRVIKLMYSRGCLQCISGFVEKYLAVANDEENVEHTGVPMSMSDTTII